MFPFEKDAKKAYEILSDALRENTLLVEDGLPEVKEFRVRETIISGKYRFVFGDRRILLYNAEKYTRIVYVDDTLAGTFMRSFHILPNTFLLESFAHSGKKVSIFSTIPRVADWVSVKKESWTFHSFS